MNMLRLQNATNPKRLRMISKVQLNHYKTEGENVTITIKWPSQSASAVQVNLQIIYRHPTLMTQYYAIFITSNGLQCLIITETEL